MTTRVYIDSTVTATRSLGKITFPITSLPDLVPGMILQWDVDNTPESLTRNRVGAAMTVVGAPAVANYTASLNETNYIDTGIAIAPYANSDMTYIGITKNPGGKFNIVGVMQVAAPMRSRCHGFEATHKPGGRWLNSAGSAWFSVLDSTAAEALGPDGLVTVSRTVVNDGTGRVGIHADIPGSGQHALVTNGTAPYPTIAGNILIGASLDHGTTVTGQVLAVLAFNRAITDAEISTIYRAYKAYYASLGKSIS